MARTVKKLDMTSKMSHEFIVFLELFPMSTKSIWANEPSGMAMAFYHCLLAF
jgi:hypothetical protein